MEVALGMRWNADDNDKEEIRRPEPAEIPFKQTNFPITINSLNNCRKEHDLINSFEPLVPCRACDHSAYSKGYGRRLDTTIMWRTTSSEYGSKAPCQHSMSVTHHTCERGFTEHLGKSGMSRSKGLNTGLDQVNVPHHFRGHIYY